MNALRTFFTVAGLVAASSGLVATTGRGATMPISIFGGADPLALVVAVLAGAVAFVAMRKDRPRTLEQPGPAETAGPIRVEGTAPLAARTSAVLVAIEGRRILLAVGDAGTSVLDRWSLEAQPTASTEPANAAQRDMEPRREAVPVIPDRPEPRRERAPVIPKSVEPDRAPVVHDLAAHRRKRRPTLPRQDLTSAFLTELDRAWLDTMQHEPRTVLPPTVASATKSRPDAGVVHLHRRRAAAA